MSKKLTKYNQCYSCVHRRTIPGSCHTRCAAPWKGGDTPKGDSHGIENGWWYFPFNFDPTWHEDLCSRYKAKP